MCIRDSDIRSDVGLGHKNIKKIDAVGKGSVDYGINGIRALTLQMFTSQPNFADVEIGAAKLPIAHVQHLLQ